MAGGSGPAGVVDDVDSIGPGAEVVDNDTLIDESTTVMVITPPPLPDEDPGQVAVAEHDHPHQHIQDCPECLATIGRLLEEQEEETDSGVQDAPMETVIDTPEEAAAPEESAPAKSGHMAPGWF